MEFGVLGDLRAHDAGGLVRSVGGPRSRDLLAVLLSRAGQSVDPLALLDAVWDGAGLGVAVVHTQVARLRRALGGQAIETTTTGYRLGPHGTDADSFLRLVRRADEAADPRSAVSALEQALALWRGERAYADVTPGLVDPEVARLGEARSKAQEVLAARHLDVPDGDGVPSALTLARDLIRREPLRERAYELAMVAAARSGLRAEALEIFHELRRTLREELGIDPGETAREIQRRVLEQETFDEGPEAIRPALPAPTNRLIGRAAELAELVGLAESRRLVTIVGPGGVGKSRLLAEFALLLGYDLAYVDLAPLESLASVEAVSDLVGKALGVGIAQDGPASLARASRPGLVRLLIDEGERSPDELAVVLETLLRSWPGLRIVVTSRRPLGALGEAQLPLAPLACPAPRSDAAESARSPAVSLLVERIADRIGAWEPGDHDLVRLGHFARRVDGLPLALELLAAQMPGHDLDDLDAALDDPLALASDEAGRAARHRTIRDTIAWSVGRLEPRDRATLARLAVFAGTFGRDAAEAVAGGSPGRGAVRDSLKALVRDALVHLERCPDGIRLRLLRTVRDLALEELEATGEAGVVRARHRTWHAERWRGALRSDALLLDVRDHYGDYLAALRSSLQDGDATALADLTLTLGRLWIYGDQLGPGLEWSERALDSGLLDELSAARVLTMRSVLLFQHDPARARAGLVRAVPVLERHAETSWLIGALDSWALERDVAGESAQACALAERAVSAARSSTPERQADALGTLAAVAAEYDPALARHAGEEAWSLALASGSAAAAASVGTNVVWAALGAERPEVALRVAAEAVVLQPPGAIPAFLHLNHAWALLVSGAPGEALERFALVAGAGRGRAEDHRTVESALGAGLALLRLERPEATAVLEATEAILERTGIHLTRWQTGLLAQARIRTGATLPGWGTSPLPRLVELVTAAAAQ